MGIKGLANPTASFLNQYWRSGGFPHVTPTPITATGGTTNTPGDGYKYHFLNSSGSFVVSDAGSTGEIEFFLVGGGGSGGDQGGGGAGGIVHGTRICTATTYPVTIGGGADSPNPNNNNPGAVGSGSAFMSMTALGGGGGNN